MDPGKSGLGFTKAGGGAFAKVRDTGLKAALAAAPVYEPDPFFMSYVGYVLDPLHGVQAPPFEALPWPGQHTLIRLP
ncbi:hypothetical protein [Corallococcus exiguus]|nr:hypothetical protein [Corallococcus exiguus]